jgi:16S rRNA C967 or C1407 C5-methylase (RsmB/RsmF family)
MISSAFLVLKPGGMLLYSTCALSTRENDSVVGKLLKRRHGKVSVLDTESEWGERTEYGILILPDKSEGMGPIYFSLMKKRP